MGVARLLIDRQDRLQVANGLMWIRRPGQQRPLDARQPVRDRRVGLGRGLRLARGRPRCGDSEARPSGHGNQRRCRATSPLRYSIHDVIIVPRLSTVKAARGGRIQVMWQFSSLRGMSALALIGLGAAARCRWAAHISSPTAASPPRPPSRGGSEFGGPSPPSFRTHPGSRRPRPPRIQAAADLQVFHDSSSPTGRPRPASPSTTTWSKTPGRYKAVHYDHGNGVAIADADGDGRTDIYFREPGGRQ